MKSKAEYQKDYLSKEENRKKVSRRQRTFRDLKAGKIVRPDTCEGCGKTPSVTPKGKIMLFFTHMPEGNAWFCPQCSAVLRRKIVEGV